MIKTCDNYCDCDNVVSIAASICKVILTKTWDANNWKIKFSKRFTENEKLRWNIFSWYLTNAIQKQSSRSVKGKGVLKICNKFTGEHLNLISIKLLFNFLKSHFCMGVLLETYCIFSEHLFPGTLLEGWFWQLLTNIFYLGLGMLFFITVMVQSFKLKTHE